MSGLEPQTRQVIDAVLEAIDIPYAACLGDEEKYLKTLGLRIISLKVALQAAQRPESHLDWTLEHLHEQLQKPEYAVDWETDYNKVLARLRGKATS